MDFPYRSQFARRSINEWNNWHISETVSFNWTEYISERLRKVCHYVMVEFRKWKCFSHSKKKHICLRVDLRSSRCGVGLLWVCVFHCVRRCLEANGQLNREATHAPLSTIWLAPLIHVKRFSSWKDFCVQFFDEW